MSLRHCWKKYQIKTTTTYRWNRYTVTSTIQYSESTSTSYAVDFTNLYDHGIETCAISRSGYTLDKQTGEFVLNSMSTGIEGAYDTLSATNDAYYDKYVIPGNGLRSAANWIAISPSNIEPNASGSYPKYYWALELENNGDVTLLLKNKYGLNNWRNLEFTLKQSVASYVDGPGTSQGQVTSTSRSAYPNNGRSGNYWYVYQGSSTSQSAGSYVEDVIGSTESQYPANGVSGSYWYVYQGSDSIDPVAVNLSQSSGLYVGLPITISVDPSTSKVYGGTVSYQYQVQINNDGQWITLGTTTETSYPYTIPTGATNLQFRVLASDDLGFTSTDYVNSASVSVVAFKPGTQQVLHRKNASGGYDVIWLETDSEVVIRPDGTTLEATLADIESRLSGLGV